MPKVALYNMKGEQVGNVELSENVFGAEINNAAMHQVIKMQLANKRQGTQSVLTRAEVSGGGIKPWRQKGTGRAYSYTVPKKIKRIAIKSALSSKVADEELIVVDELKLDAPKTKVIADMLKALDVKKTLIVVCEKDDTVYRSARNIEGVLVLPVNNLNVYDILKYHKFIITKDAVSKVEVFA